jgi:DNA-binding CsgD family transcriptional regulator
MGNLTPSEVSRLVACCAELYSWNPDDQEHSFAEHTARLLPCLVRADVTAYQSFDAQGNTTALALSSRQEEIGRHTPAFDHYLPEHPLVSRVRETGCTAALRITDLVSWREFERTGLYNEFFRQVGLGHQLAASLPAARGEVIGLVCSRDSGAPDFSDGDREMLEHFRLHVIQAQETAFRLSEMRAQLQRTREMLDALEEGVISIDTSLRVSDWSQRATILLEKHFGSPRSHGVPDQLLAWVRGQVSPGALAPSRERVEAQRFTTVLETSAGHLRLHLGRRRGGWLLVIVEPAPAAPRSLPEHLQRKLTPREQEVLQWISAGKTNPEIAIIQGTSPRTVQKHVEHILKKLNVENRHSAALQALEFSL